MTRSAPLSLLVALLGGSAVLVACSKGAEPAATSAAGAAPAQRSAIAVPAPAASAIARAAAPVDAHLAGIAWKEASRMADVDAAFDLARAENKPVFVYWGAKWCPPCNQVKATLFNRHDFIERSRGFVPVYVDGDSPGAQKIGARFKVSGYPTMVLFDRQGREVTRLPGEVDAARYTEVLTLGLDSARPARELLADALARPATLAANDWRLLAFYSWDTDQQQLVAKGRLPATLAALADACPAEPREAAVRLRLKALAAADAARAEGVQPAATAQGNGKVAGRGKAAGSGKVARGGEGQERSGGKTPSPTDEATRSTLLALLADPRAARAQTDMLTGYAAEIVRAASAKDSPARARLLAGFDRALTQLAADTTLSRADRMQALVAQVDLAQIDRPTESAGGAGANANDKAAKAALPDALLAEIRAQSASADREIVDGYERQAVITQAAYLLEHAGLGAESDRLLEANLARSHSPYYLMSELAANAKKRGDKEAALRWSRAAYEKSEGPATRLQWGASYVGALIELAPADEAAIEAATEQVWREAATQPDAFYQRSARSLERIGARLAGWNEGARHRAAMARLQARLDALCAEAPRSDEERASCRGLLAAPKAKGPRA